MKDATIVIDGIGRLAIEQVFSGGDGFDRDNLFAVRYLEGVLKGSAAVVISLHEKGQRFSLHRAASAYLNGFFSYPSVPIVFLLIIHLHISRR